ncbi:MAG: Bug family tripartite tricarboxylate transporter substrate binding protein [Sphaerospermopsis kisseleviana]
MQRRICRRIVDAHYSHTTGTVAMHRIVRLFCALALLSAATLRCALAQDYPDKPVRLIVPWPAGGLVDIAARVMATSLQSALGQPFVVENKPGAGGAIGAETVAKATPDGYTLALTTSALNMNAALKRTPRYSIANEFTPVAAVAYAPSVLVARNGLGVKTVTELVALARSKPGKLTYASAGQGSPAHLYGELFKSLAKVDMLHVPYKGAPQAMADLMAGEVDMLFANAAVALPQIKADRVRALAVTSARTFSAIPELPTLIEAGLPTFQADQWLGILAPRGTPPAVVQKLRETIAQALVRDEVRAKFSQNGMSAAPAATSAEFTAVLNREFDTWKTLVESANLKAD